MKWEAEAGPCALAPPPRLTALPRPRAPPMRPPLRDAAVLALLPAPARRRGRVPRPLGLRRPEAGAAAEGPAGRLAAQPHRRLRAGPRGGRGPAAVAAGRPLHPRAPAVPRPDRPAAHAGGGRRLRAGRLARGLRACSGPAASVAALRRALGATLARPGALRRHQRLREGPAALGLAVPRLGD